jgi:hypothetical protein
MSTTESESATSQYVPFTPFEQSYAFEAEPVTAPLLEHSDAAQPMTPFVSEYAGALTPTPEAFAFQELLSELYDREFDETLADLAHEAWEAVTQRAEPFGEARVGESEEQFLQEWARPVRDAGETMLENIAQAASEHDLASMSEAELDRFFEAFEPRETGLEQHFENFLGGLWKKVKSIAKSAVSAVGKGIMMIPGLSGLIDKLKALVKPLLDRVLRSAIDRLPPTLQPLARQLAQRVLGTSGEAEAEEYEAAPAAPDPAALQQQFDLEAATLMFAPDELEQELTLNEAAAVAERDPGAAVAQLHEARARFVDQLASGADPEQAMEQFIPAVMAVLPIARTVIGTIGRGRVVSFLAGYLTNFVAQYVPREAATRLSSAIVDAGLRMLSLEAPSGEEPTGSRVACEAIAQTVEDTVRRVGELNESVFEEPQLLEAAVTEAFHEAAAENFPPQVIVPELHEAPVHATWVAMPRRGPRKYYKKYTHVFDVEITPQIADSITTFGGAKLSAFLKDQLGLTPPARARVHLYQSIAGTTLRRIAHLERGVPGLGKRPHAARQLHPLTVRAAATLLHHPKLGRDVPGVFRSARHTVAIGQRFYYLEIAGAHPVNVPPGHVGAGAVRRTSDVNVTLDFRKDEFRVFVYFSETDAQEIAAKIRSRDLTAVLVLAKRAYESGVRVALGGDIKRHVKILSETPPQEQLFGLDLKQLAAGVKERVIKEVVNWVGQALAEFVKTGAGEFVAAADNPADGVTMVVHIVNPPGAPLVRRLLHGEGIGAGDLKDIDSLFRGKPRLSVNTVPGFSFD